MPHLAYRLLSCQPDPRYTTLAMPSTTTCEEVLGSSSLPRPERPGGRKPSVRRAWRDARALRQEERRATYLISALHNVSTPDWRGRSGSDAVGLCHVSRGVPKAWSFACHSERARVPRAREARRRISLTSSRRPPGDSSLGSAELRRTVCQSSPRDQVAKARRDGGTRSPRRSALRPTLERDHVLGVVAPGLVPDLLPEDLLAVRRSS